MDLDAWMAESQDPHHFRISFAKQGRRSRRLESTDAAEATQVFQDATLSTCDKPNRVSGIDREFDAAKLRVRLEPVGETPR
jgi:hypothetical protein